VLLRSRAKSSRARRWQGDAEYAVDFALNETRRERRS